MDKEVIKQYEGQNVKITIRPGHFCLRGTITKVNESDFDFKTEWKTSKYCFDIISSLIPME